MTTKTTTANINQVRLNELCLSLKLSTIKREALLQAEQAKRQQTSHEDYLLELLELEWQEKQIRATERRIKTAHFPFCKTIESFDFMQIPHLPEVQIRQFISGNYLKAAEPIIFMGEPGTGKTHLSIALGYAAAQQGAQVRFITLAQMANQLMEAKDAKHLSNTINKFIRPELLIIDELGYVPLTAVDAELIFQVLSQRQERKSTIITTNLPFSEWPKTFPEPRLCKAIIDRCTFNVHLIDTGKTSYRLSKTMEKQL